MAVHSKLLLPPMLLTVTTATTLYTAPAGETAILKTIHEVNGNATARWYSLTLSASGPPGIPWVWRRVVSGSSSSQMQTWLVIPAGWSVIATQELASAITLTFSGTELEGVPS